MAIITLALIIKLVGLVIVCGCTAIGVMCIGTGIGDRSLATGMQPFHSRRDRLSRSGLHRGS